MHRGRRRCAVGASEEANNRARGDLHALHGREGAAAAAGPVGGEGNTEQANRRSGRWWLVGVECELASPLKNVSRTEPAQAHSEIQACTLCYHEPEPGSTEQTHVTMNRNPEIDFARLNLAVAHGSVFLLMDVLMGKNPNISSLQAWRREESRGGGGG